MNKWQGSFLFVPLSGFSYLCSTCSFLHHRWSSHFVGPWNVNLPWVVSFIPCFLNLHRPSRRKIKMIRSTVWKSTSLVLFQRRRLRCVLSRQLPSKDPLEGDVHSIPLLMNLHRLPEKNPLTQISKSTSHNLRMPAPLSRLTALS